MMSDEEATQAEGLGALAVVSAASLVVTDSLVVSAVLGGLGAYAATRGDSLGNAFRKVGSTAAGVLDKAKELNGQYNVLDKTKGALDFTVDKTQQLNDQYGVTDKLGKQASKVADELQISDAIEKVKSQVQSTTDSVKSKVDELKN